jgi:hypothetical protein
LVSLAQPRYAHAFFVSPGTGTQVVDVAACVVVVDDTVDVGVVTELLEIEDEVLLELEDEVLLELDSVEERVVVADESDVLLDEEEVAVVEVSDILLEVDDELLDEEVEVDEVVVDEAPVILPDDVLVDEDDVVVDEIVVVLDNDVDVVDGSDEAVALVLLDELLDEDVEMVEEVVDDDDTEAIMYMFKRDGPPQYSFLLFAHTILHCVAETVFPATRAEPALIRLPQ